MLERSSILPRPSRRLISGRCESATFESCSRQEKENSQCRPNCFAFSWEACSILTATPAPASCFLTTSLVFLLISSEEILPSEMTSRFFVSGSVLMTQRGVPTRSEPSMMSQPRMIAGNDRRRSVAFLVGKQGKGKRNARSRLAKQVMMLSRQGKTAVGAASAFLAATIEAL